MRELIVVRTHLADAPSLAAFDRYAAASGRDVTFCCDERKGPVETGSRRKVTLDAAAMEALGLLPHPNAGWRCGDYFYYATRAAMPDHDFYWLVEPDVLVNAPDLAAFLDGFADPATDFTAARLGPRDARWVWHRTVADDYPENPRFTGRIHWVQLDTGEDDHDHLVTPEDRLRVAMTRQ